ncbi:MULTISPECIES: MFS transporter [unclassified Paenibacillus]|uniref:CynX/NimT family MFS transporter n=1 Tax=unclassified Paenibacillus TaxID=185978 RepID=UPI001B788D87|nr:MULTISPECIES: MFS transporter [unclassified Paenibacillus]MBP1155613.1 CP family cyanate transporter-like MFS transporter [Paenibacillus sp. PvP091]MBP1169001.1 CP family cyanate transporter-like MFS transporter [Paenibacillus sp. PvR098]MBP2440029.1 CP family cyanate transporter-like MFS transporter [Paenibacillus sp. PvP052]
MLVIGIILVAANLRAPLTAVGPIIGEIRNATGISNTLAGTLTTLPLLAFALLSPFAARIARKIGIEVTLLAGMIALTVGILIRSIPGIGLLFLGTLLLGLAISVGNVLVPSLIKREFPERVGVMTGIYAVSMNLCGAVASGISIPITRGLGLGWGAALGCWALLSFIAILIWLPQLRNRRHGSNSHVKKTGGHLWRSRLAWNVTIYMGSQSLVFYMLVTWLPEILQQRGMSNETAGWMLSMLQFIILPITFIVPVLASRVSSQRGMVVAAGISLIIGCLGLLSGNLSLIVVWLVLMGVGVGTAFSLAMMFFVLRTRDSQQAAELSGMAQAVGYLMAATGPTLFGLIHDVTNGWTYSLIFLLAAALLLMFSGYGAASGYVTSKETP